MSDDAGMSKTREEAEVLVAAYERDRCACGGSPSWVNPRSQFHLADCQAGRGSEPEAMTQEVLYALRKMRPFFEPRKGHAPAADIDDAKAVLRGLAERGLKIVRESPVIHFQQEAPDWTI